MLKTVPKIIGKSVKNYFANISLETLFCKYFCFLFSLQCSYMSILYLLVSVILAIFGAVILTEKIIDI